MSDPVSDTPIHRAGFDREAARERCDAATEGPWYANVNDLIGGTMVGNRDKPSSEYDNRRESDSGDREVADFISAPDADFIAHARTDLPAALDQLEAAEAERDELRRVMSLPAYAAAREASRWFNERAAAHKRAEAAEVVGGRLTKELAQAEALLEEAVAEVEGQWACIHDEYCTNMTFDHEDGSRCHAPRPEGLAKWRAFLAREDQK